MDVWDTIGLLNKMLEDGKFPKAAIDESEGECLTCAKQSKLGNNLCRDCWDYVVEKTKINHPEWPNAEQFIQLKESK